VLAAIPLPERDFAASGVKRRRRPSSGFGVSSSFSPARLPVEATDVFVSHVTFENP
jgi:hypothetical protein